LRIVIDSYAWIEQFKGSSNGNKIREVLEDAAELYTPDIVLAEIARKYMREGIAIDSITERLEQITSNSKIIFLDSKLAVESAKCYLELNEKAKKNKLNSPSLTDGIVLATGRTLKAKVLTGDEHFKSLHEAIWIKP
jgi:predicted nucleic acid-binding protein